MSRSGLKTSPECHLGRKQVRIYAYTPRKAAAAREAATWRTVAAVLEHFGTGERRQAEGAAAGTAAGE
eukprot:1964649-Prymnesium_polylepis.1